jgi:peptidyl-prolyl cis-trans isomerase-like protein 2
MFLTAKEWKELGGKKEHKEEASRRLPFDHCALTFTPWTTPVCDPHGNVFELMSAQP